MAVLLSGNDDNSAAGTFAAVADRELAQSAPPPMADFLA